MIRTIDVAAINKECKSTNKKTWEPRLTCFYTFFIDNDVSSRISRNMDRIQFDQWTYLWMKLDRCIFFCVDSPFKFALFSSNISLTFIFDFNTFSSLLSNSNFHFGIHRATRWLEVVGELSNAKVRFDSTWDNLTSLLGRIIVKVRSLFWNGKWTIRAPIFDVKSAYGKLFSCPIRVSFFSCAGPTSG